MPVNEPTVSPSLVRGYLRAAENHGILARAKSVAPLEIADLFEASAGLGWVPVSKLMKLVRALGEVSDKAMVRTLAHELAQNTVGPVILPLIRTVLALSAGSPASLFKRMDTIALAQMKGGTFNWTELSPTSGTVEIGSEIPADDYWWAGWEGLLLFGFDVCKVKGTADSAVVAPDQRSARITLRWSQD